MDVTKSLLERYGPSYSSKKDLTLGSAKSSPLWNKVCGKEIRKQKYRLLLLPVHLFIIDLQSAHTQKALLAPHKAYE